LKAGIDSNVILYGEKYEDGGRYDTVRQIGQVAGAEIIVCVLVLGEVYRVLTRKAKRDPMLAADTVLAWTQSFGTCDVTLSGLEEALTLSAAHRVHIWDAVILTTYRQAGCSVFLSEDMQDGFMWHGLEVVNPFKRPLESLLRRLAAP
jgi:predicted nucleic acid-binding protein